MLRYVIAVLLLAAVCQATNNTTTVVMETSPTPATVMASESITTPTPAETTSPTSGAPSVFAPTFFLLAVSTVFAAVLRI